MSDVSLQSATLRELAHALLDKLLDERAAGELRPRMDIRLKDVVEPVTPRSPSASTAKPAIVPPKTRARPGRKPRGDVLIGCTKQGTKHQVILTLSTELVGRLGLGPKFPCDCGLSLVDRTFTLGPGCGVRMREAYSGQRHLVRLGTARRWNVPEPHRSEVCEYHFDLEHRLVIQAPAWLKRAAAATSPAKHADKKPEADQPASCRKMTELRTAIKCHACKRATATVECNLCPTLLCNACWESHVRTHWHADHKGKAAMAARDARQAMRSEA
jgi:hypothetical protein